MVNLDLTIPIGNCGNLNDMNAFTMQLQVIRRSILLRE